MNLIQINTELEKIVKELEAKLPALNDLEYEYQDKYGTFLLTSKWGNAQAREADAKKQCYDSGLTRKYAEAKLEVRMLLTRKEVLFEISRNLRSIDK